MSGARQVREELVACLPRLRRLARAIARNRHDADDLVQITIERALLRFGQRRPGTRLESWMFGIMKHAWIDEVRSRGRRDRLFTPVEDATDLPGSDGEQTMQAMSLHAAMMQIPDDQRFAVALVLVEGLSYREAADVLEIPIGTLTSRLARGREALIALLGEDDARARTQDSRS